MTVNSGESPKTQRADTLWVNAGLKFQVSEARLRMDLVTIGILSIYTDVPSIGASQPGV